MVVICMFKQRAPYDRRSSDWSSDVCSSDLRTRYTLRALQYLADRFGEGPVQLKEIAESQNIPAKFLTVLLSEMSREGLVGTQRGREGGSWLLLPPVDVRTGDIIRLTRGSLALVPCAIRSAHERFDISPIGIEQFWVRV